jgi:hypothetical protein
VRESERRKTAGARESWVGEKEELGHAGGRGKEKGQVGSGCKEEKREGKRKESVGRAQLEKEGEKELHLNTFKFEF